MCTVRRAHVLLYKGKAEVIEQLDQPLRSATGSFIWPHVIRLVALRPRAAGDPTEDLAARALRPRRLALRLLRHDGGRLTLDHVVPRSKGGESIWENVVTACAPCNLRKGDRSLEQVGMVLQTPPRAPQPVLFIKLAAPRIPQALDAVPRRSRHAAPPPPDVTASRSASYHLSDASSHRAPRRRCAPRRLGDRGRRAAAPRPFGRHAGARTITVSGHGTVTTVPDRASFDFTVETRAPTRRRLRSRERATRPGRSPRR